jgi:hypothetical protein
MYVRLARRSASGALLELSLELSNSQTLELSPLTLRSCISVFAAYMFIYIYISIYLYLYIYICVCVCVCVCTCVSVCICVVGCVLIPGSRGFSSHVFSSLISLSLSSCWCLFSHLSIGNQVSVHNSTKSLDSPSSFRCTPSVPLPGTASRFRVCSLLNS